MANKRKGIATNLKRWDTNIRNIIKKFDIFGILFVMLFYC